MKKHIALKFALSAAIASLVTGISCTANAAAFQLVEQNAINTENFAAGAAVSDDASTAFSNPAGMIRILHQQLVVSGNFIMSDAKFSGTDTWSLQTGGTMPPQAGSAEGGGSHFLPALAYVSPINDRWAFGFTIATPFGLATDYGNGSLLRYAATRTSLQTTDISPSLAVKLTDKLSLGVGVDAEYLDAEFNGVASGGPGTDSKSINEADAWGYGYHAGLLYQITPQTRIGLAYRSQIRFDATGTSKLEGPLGAYNPLTNSDVRKTNNLQSSITLPPSTTLSAHEGLNEQWGLDESVTYTQWSTFNKVLRLHNVMSVKPDDNGGLINNLITVSSDENFRDTWRFAVGASYKPVASKWLFRTGAGYDESPVRNANRTPRLPDGDRIGVAIGTHYQAVKTLGIDVGYTHLFFVGNHRSDNVKVQTGNQIATINGSYTNHADIMGAQLTWDID